jgi:peptidylprolyl isomerase
MKTILRTGLVLAAAALVIDAAAAPAGKTMTDVLAAAKPSDWRTLDPENTLYLELAAGRVVIELAPEFAPLHVANVRTLVRGKYFDGLSIVRSQDNFVVQCDPAGGPQESVGRSKER